MGDAAVLPEQVTQGAMVVPVAVQPPCAAGIDQAALRRFDFKLHFRALTTTQRRALFAREALGDERVPVPELIARHLETLTGLAPGDFATVCRQRTLLGEVLTPEQFLRRLAAECRLKQVDRREAA